MDRLFFLALGTDVEALRAALLAAKEQGLDVNQVNQFGSNILHYAVCEKRRRNIVEICVGAGRDAGFRAVNAKTQRGEGGTALHLAMGSEGVVEELCEGAGREAGFSVIAAHDEQGQTALHLARSEQEVDVILRTASRVGEEERHALVHAVTSGARASALHWCFYYPSAVQGLTKHCSDAELDFLLHAKDRAGNNPLRSGLLSSQFDAGLSTLLRGLAARGWKGKRDFMEPDKEGDGLSPLHVVIAFHPPWESPRANRLMALLLRPGGEEGEGQLYEGGVDVNGRCSKRTGECRLLGKMG
jgi:hypothetical protein